MDDSTNRMNCEEAKASPSSRIAQLGWVVAFGSIGAVLFDLAPLQYNRGRAWERVARVVYAGQPWSDAETALKGAGFHLIPERANPAWTRICIRAPVIYRGYVAVRNHFDHNWQNWSSIVGSVRHTSGTVNKLQQLHLSYTIF